MQRFWFLCVAMMVLGGCVADTRDLHMDGGIPTHDAMVLTDDSVTVTPDDAGATDGDEGWSDEDFRRASDACFNLYTAIYCQEFPNEEFESENDLALHCDALVLTEAVPDCLDEFITSYECGNLSVQEIQSCEDRPNRAWETDCDYDKITECRSHMDGGNDDGSIVEPADAFAAAVNDCIQLNLEIWCGSYPNSDFQNLEELRQICEYTVTREAAPNCIAEFISLYECGTELFSNLPICQPNQPRSYPWTEPCGANALALCQATDG